MTVVPSFPQVEMVCIPLGKVLMGQEHTIIQVGYRYELCFKEAMRESNELCFREAVSESKRKVFHFKVQRLCLFFQRRLKHLFFSEFLK